MPDQARRAGGTHHAYYAQFVDYGDAEGLGEGLAEQRRRITRAGLSGAGLSRITPKG